MKLELTSFAFGARVIFVFEKRNKPYKKYGAVSIAEEKFAIAQKHLQRSQLCWLAGRSGAEVVC